MLKRPISTLGKNRVSVILCLIIFCITWGMTGCQQQTQQPTQETTTTQQPVQVETGANFVKITSPQPGDQADSFLIVNGTYTCSQDMTLYLSLYTEDGRKLASVNPGRGQANPPTNISFKQVLNFIPPTSADGYLDACFIDSVGNAGSVMAHVPIKLETRSADPSAYPTACVIAETNILDQPNGKITSGVDKGDAVTVLKSSNGWSQVLTYIFEAEPNVGWVPSNILTIDTTGLTEGQLNTDVAFMTGPPPNGKPDTSHPYQEKKGTPVKIGERENDWVGCWLPTGFERWVPIKDIDFVGPSVSSVINNSNEIN